MSKHSYYKLSTPSILQYYNMFGLDLKLIDPRTIETEVRYLEDLIPDIAYQTLPKSSLAVAEQLSTFIDKICCLFGYDQESELLKSSYYSSVIGILSVLTSLNLIPEKSENYLLNFERVNRILLLVLSEINNTPFDTVINFANLLGEGKVRELRDLTKTMSYSYLLSILALNPSPDIPDYEMFLSETSSEIDGKKLYELAKNNICKGYKPHQLQRVFNRPSYLGCYLSTPKDK